MEGPPSPLQWRRAPEKGMCLTTRHLRTTHDRGHFFFSAPTLTLHATHDRLPHLDAHQTYHFFSNSL